MFEENSFLTEARPSGSDNVHHHHIEIDLSNEKIVNVSSDLENSLVNYVLNESRILYCQYLNTWQEYLDEHETEDLTSADLRAVFLKRVLPVIFDKNIPVTSKEQFKVLDLHEHFERTSRGYQLKNLNINHKINMYLLPDVDYHAIKVNDLHKEKAHIEAGINNLEEAATFVFETQKSNPSTSQFCVVAGAKPNEAKPKSPKKLSAENHALSSAVISIDYELFHNALFGVEELLRRMRKSRSLFMQTGRHEITLDPNDLLEKIEKFSKMRKAVTNLMHKRF